MDLAPPSLDPASPAMAADEAYLWGQGDQSVVLAAQLATMRRLRIALIGSRGIPARYGGYETLMEELSTRLAERGHRVTVYCRRHYTPRHLRQHRGVELVVLPTIPTKHLDTPVHTFLSCLHAVQRDFDAGLVVNSANALFVPLLRSAEIPVALHVDGIERRRAKWGRLGRSVYSLSEKLATAVPTTLVTDAIVVHDYYRQTLDTDSTVIAYGVDPQPQPPDEVMAGLGLEPRRFFLYVSRFEPENNPHRIAEAYRQVHGDLPLVMVGDAPYAGRFIDSFTADADPRVLFPGAIYGAGYRELLSNALAYIHATEVGGTHPALVEAMDYGNCVLVNDVPENREVAAETGLYFHARDPATLAPQLCRLVDDDDLAARQGQKCRLRAAECYSWSRVVDLYEELFHSLSQDS